MKAEIARTLHGFIFQGLSLKGQERLADRRASWIKHTGRRIYPGSRGIWREKRRGWLELGRGPALAAMGAPLLCVFMSSFLQVQLLLWLSFASEIQATEGAFPSEHTQQ